MSSPAPKREICSGRGVNNASGKTTFKYDIDIGQAVQNAADGAVNQQEKIDAESDSAAVTLDLLKKVQALDDWSHRFLNIFLKLEQRIERPWFRKGQALLKELSAS
jgi:hypothetical protein